MRGLEWCFGPRRLATVATFVCALFASVAYNWTFYYLLALAVAPALVTRINQVRANHGLRALTVASPLTTAATKHAGRDSRAGRQVVDEQPRPPSEPPWHVE